MTTVSIGGGCRLALSPKKAWPQSPPFPSQKTAIILIKSLHRVGCGPGFERAFSGFEDRHGMTIGLDNWSPMDEIL